MKKRDFETIEDIYLNWDAEDYEKAGLNPDWIEYQYEINKQLKELDGEDIIFYTPEYIKDTYKNKNNKK